MWRLVCLLCALAGSAAAQDQVISARYVDPSSAYGHGALPNGEFSGLEVLTARGTHRVRLEGQVFEDTAPRLADLDGDGAAEIVTVVSIFDQGAQIVVWNVQGGALAPLLRTAPIGTRHRWLAIAGIADLDGDGRMEIAYVDRPHLARVLRVVAVWREGQTWRTARIGSAEGHTNHRYGAPDIEGGIFDCGQGPEIVTADRAWQRVLATRLADGRLTTRDIGGYSGAASLTCR